MQKNRYYRGVFFKKLMLNSNHRKDLDISMTHYYMKNAGVTGEELPAPDGKDIAELKSSLIQYVQLATRCRNEEKRLLQRTLSKTENTHIMNKISENGNN